MNFAISYIEYRCSNCGQVLWSDTPEEIEAWKKLHEKGVLVCPVCQSKMQLVGQKAILHEIAE